MHLCLLTVFALMQARQSVIVIDGVWNVASTQLKFILAIIASSAGGCYPIVMVASVEIAVGLQPLVMCRGGVYSSVHSVSAVK